MEFSQICELKPFEKFPGHTYCLLLYIERYFLFTLKFSFSSLSRRREGVCARL